MKAAVGFVFVTLLLDVIGLGIIIPVMPDLIVELRGGTLSEASRYGGFLMFAYAVFQFICAPIVGGLSDRYGRRPVLLLSLLGFGLDYLLLALAPNLSWLFVGRILAGIFGASFTTCAAYIADVSTPEKRAQNFGMIGVAFGLGFILGPVIGGLLGQYGTRVPFYAASVLSLLNLAYGFFILPESLAAENRRKFEWKRSNPLGTLRNLGKYPKLRGLLGSLLFVYVASYAVQGTWNYFTKEKFGWEEDMVGWSLGFVGLLSAIVQGGLIRVVIPKLGNERSIVTGFLLYTLGLALLAFASEEWMMFAFLVPYCLGGIAGPAVQGIMAGLVEKNQQGELQGAMSAMMSLAMLIGPLMMTNLFAHFTNRANEIYFPGAPMLAGAVLTLVSLALTMMALKKARIKEPIPVAEEAVNNQG